GRLLFRHLYHLPRGFVVVAGRGCTPSPPSRAGRANLPTSSSSWPPSSWSPSRLTSSPAGTARPARPWSGRFAAPLESHRIPAQLLGLLAAPPLVVVQIDVELGQAHHGQPPLGHRGVEHPGVVGHEKVHDPFALYGLEPQTPHEPLGIPADVAVHGRDPDLRPNEGGSGVEGEGVREALQRGLPSQ